MQINDFENAFVYNQKYNALNDSIMTTEKDKAFQKINEFEDKKKQQEIQLLTKDSEIQKLKIKRQKINSQFNCCGWSFDFFYWLLDC